MRFMRMGMASAVALLAGAGLVGTATASQASPAAPSSLRLPAPPAFPTFLPRTATTSDQLSPAAALVEPGGSFFSPRGYSSYYDGYAGAGLLWRPTACGTYNLGSSIRDRITSVDNNSPSRIDLYNWTGSWTYLDSVQPWTAVNLPFANDIIDAVDIWC